MDYSRLKGLFITFEGGEGSGKTSQLECLGRLAADNGVECVLTREPGDTRIGRELRRILLAAGQDVHPMAELLMYEADRAQHVGEVIRPALDAGKLVACDRYADSTLAYQGAKGIDIGLIRALNAMATESLNPHLTFLLDVQPETGLARAMKRLASHGSNESRFERLGIDYHANVRERYLQLAAESPHRFRVVDASQTPEDVSRNILDCLDEYLSTR